MGIGFYTPCGVTLFGTWKFNADGQGFEFLYALWRDVVWNAVALAAVIALVSVLFLYALWRDVVWNQGCHVR